MGRKEFVQPVRIESRDKGRVIEGTKPIPVKLKIKDATVMIV